MGSREVRGIHISDHTVIISIIKIIYPMFFILKTYFKKIENIAHKKKINNNNNKIIPKINPNK